MEKLPASVLAGSASVFSKLSFSPCVNHIQGFEFQDLSSCSVVEFVYLSFQSENVGEKDMEMSLNGGGTSTHSLTSSHLSGYYRLCQEARQRDGRGGPTDMEEDEEQEEEEGELGEPEDRPVPLPPLLILAPLLSNSTDLDSGVGRTDDSTRYEESSEHDLLGDQTSAPNTNTTNTPGSARKFRVGPSPR